MKIEDYNVIPNNSKVYFNGSRWKSNNCGEFTIIAHTDRFITSKKGYKNFCYYLCQFDDGFINEAKSTEIKLGKVRNYNTPSICGIGYRGEGLWNFYENQKATKEYRVFHNIINRCYNPNAPEYKEYGEKGVKLDEKWHNFQNFCNDLKKLPNYENWKNDTIGYWEIDKDFLCEKLNINPKIYSLNTCMFIPHWMNMSERNKRVSLTGKTYIAINVNGEQILFNNIKLFAREHDLNDANISKCIKNTNWSHKGWKFKVLNDKELINKQYEALQNSSIEELTKMLNALN